VIQSNKKDGENLINAPYDKEFVFHDGSRAKNILELVTAVEKLNDHEFHHFVNAHKNDFANWTEYVLADKNLSEKLRSVNTKHDTLNLLKDRINDVVASRMEGHPLHDVSNTPRLEYHNGHANTESHHEVHHETRHETNAVESKVVEPKHDTDHEHHAEHSPKHSMSFITFRRHNKDTDNKNSKDDIKEEKVTEKIVEKTKKDEQTGGKRDSEEEKEEKDMAKKAGKMWFKIFSGKKVSKDKLRNLESKEEDKLRVEKELKTEIQSDKHENALWVILYISLIVLIIILLIYKLFL